MTQCEKIQLEINHVRTERKVNQCRNVQPQTIPDVETNIFSTVETRVAERTYSQTFLD